MANVTLQPESAVEPAALQPTGYDGLGGEVLLRNAWWFTRIRWVVVATLAVFGSLCAVLNAHGCRGLGLEPAGAWPWIAAAVVALANLVTIAWLHRIRRPLARRVVSANLWFQVVADLVVLTAMVYLVGPTDTVLPFVYLFHITLACIFFGRRDSFLVALLSAVLFLGTVMLVALGALPRHGLLAAGRGIPSSPALFALPAVFVWFVVWYLVSTIANAVRQRDRELDAANRRLVQADEQKNLQMLRVTHDLKAPFSGIENHIQVLRHVLWDQTPEPVRQIIAKIETRSATLRTRIGDILMLGSLRSPDVAGAVSEPVELRALLGTVARDLDGLARTRGVTVRLEGGPATVHSDPRRLTILFTNLVSNAVTYSREQGTVEVTIEDPGRRLSVSVADHGIGISEKAMPHIFEDFYRAGEAANFNPNSTGLGLAIVRQVALNLGLTVEVTSEEGRGTTFRVLFPPAPGNR